MLWLRIVLQRYVYVFFNWFGVGICYILDGWMMEWGARWMDAGLHVREAKILILCVFFS